jgi:HtrA serine peptidase 2
VTSYLFLRMCTDAHVVEGARKVNITLRDGTQLVGQVENLDSLADVAIVRIDGQGKQLPAATLGRSSNLRVGEWIVAMGSPGGNLKDTVTVGIVSALLRQSTDLGMSGRRMVYIQTDCAINQGNSGGPIINIDGEVVAMSTMKAAQLDGVGFAIPIDVAMDMVWQMRQFGRVLRPYLGFKMVTLRPSVLAELRHTVTGFPLELKRGVLIAQVLPGSPAAKAGLLPGDVVVEFDNVPVVESVQVHNQLGDKVGRRVPLRVVRIHDGKARLMDFTVVTEAAQ